VVARPDAIVEILVYNNGARKVAANGKTVTLRLNQQQLEFIDRLIAQGLAADRAALMRLALREYAAKRAAAAEPRK
jgi:hypothetical protein